MTNGTFDSSNGWIGFIRPGWHIENKWKFAQNLNDGASNDSLNQRVENIKENEDGTITLSLEVDAKNGNGNGELHHTGKLDIYMRGILYTTLTNPSNSNTISVVGKNGAQVNIFRTAGCAVTRTLNLTTFV